MRATNVRPPTCDHRRSEHEYDGKRRPADRHIRKPRALPGQAALYAAALRLHRATPAELAEAVDRPAGDVLDALDTLVRLGAVDRRREEVVARHPAAVIGRLVAERLDRMALESRRLDEMIAAAGRLARHYDTGRDWRGGGCRSSG